MYLTMKQRKKRKSEKLRNKKKKRKLSLRKNSSIIQLMIEKRLKLDIFERVPIVALIW